MNKKEALKLLIENLEKYSQNGFKFHELFWEEFQELLLDAKGSEKEIFALLIKQMNFVKSLGREVYKADSNEIIKHQEREYYSLHLKGKNFNLRFLMTFIENNPVFLCAFYERAGKKATNYSTWTPVLETRVKVFLGEAG